MAARKLEKNVDPEKNTFTVGFTSGATRTVKVSDIPEEIVTQLALHGLSQKATDAGAGKDAEETETRVNAVLDALLAGDWTTRGEGTGGASRPTLVAEAVARLKKIELADAIEKVKALPDDKRKALQASPSVQQAIAEIKLERAKAKAKAERGEATEGDDVLAGV